MFSQFSLSSFRKPLFLAALAIGAASGSVWAADGTDATPDWARYQPNRPYRQIEPRQDDARPTAPASNGGLSIDQIGEMLDTYYPGKNTISNNGHTHYEINIERGTWKFHLNVNLSPNGRVLWLTAPLVTVEDPSKLSPTALVELLKKNADLGPMFFQFNSRQNLQLTEPIANNDLSGEHFQSFMEQFLKAITSTEPLWREETLTAAGTDSHEESAPVAHAPAAVRPRNPLAK